MWTGAVAGRGYAGRSARTALVGANRVTRFFNTSEIGATTCAAHWARGCAERWREASSADKAVTVCGRQSRDGLRQFLSRAALSVERLFVLSPHRSLPAAASYTAAASSALASCSIARSVHTAATAHSSPQPLASLTPRRPLGSASAPTRGGNSVRPVSEYQYYEFQTLDRPLRREEQEQLRAISTCARITATSFTNTYDWGDLSGSPRRMVERYFDAHLYVTNWGTHRLMLRLPKEALTLRVADGTATRQTCLSHRSRQSCQRCAL
ncbi:hypothetical protein [Streptomyces sp. NPDC002520]